MSKVGRPTGTPETLAMNTVAGTAFRGFTESRTVALENTAVCDSSRTQAVLDTMILRRVRDCSR